MVLWGAKKGLTPRVEGDSVATVPDCGRSSMQLLTFLREVEAGRMHFVQSTMGAAGFQAALRTAQEAADRRLIMTLSVRSESRTGQRLADRFSVQGLMPEGRSLLLSNRQPG